MLERTLQATQRKWEFSFNFLMDFQYKKTNTMNQDEMGLYSICSVLHFVTDYLTIIQQIWNKVNF